MTDHDEKQRSLDSSTAELRKRNIKFDQERADSLDHIKQSGKSDDDSKPPKPATDEPAKP